MSDDGFDEEESLGLLICDFHSENNSALLVDVYVKGKITKDYAKSLSLDVLDSEDFRVKTGKKHLIRMVKFEGNTKFTPGTVINRHVNIELKDLDLKDIEFKPSEVSKVMKKEKTYVCSEKTKRLIKLLLSKDVNEINLDIEDVRNLNSDGEDDENDPKIIIDHLDKMNFDISENQMSVITDDVIKVDDIVSCEVSSLIQIGFLSIGEFAIDDDQAILKTPVCHAYGDYIKYRDLWFWDEVSGWETRLTRIHLRNIGKKFHLYDKPNGNIKVDMNDY